MRPQRPDVIDFPPVFAGEMCDRGSVEQQSPPRFLSGDLVANVLCVSIDDDRGRQIKACHTLTLTFGGAIADFTSTPNPQSILQGMMGFGFVQTNIGAAPRVGIEQPFYDKQHSFGLPDSRSTRASS